MKSLLGALFLITGILASFVSGAMFSGGYWWITAGVFGVCIFLIHSAFQFFTEKYQVLKKLNKISYMKVFVSNDIALLYDMEKEEYCLFKGEYPPEGFFERTGLDRRIFLTPVW